MKKQSLQKQIEELRAGIESLKNTKIIYIDRIVPYYPPIQIQPIYPSYPQTSPPYPNWYLNNGDNKLLCSDKIISLNQSNNGN